jgi:peptidoglycan/LPS O-acetylase OafA/YrhL
MHENQIPNPWQSRTCLLHTIGLISALAFAIACLKSEFTKPFMYDWGFTLIALSAGGLILMAYGTSSGILSAFLRFNPLVKTGMISYGLYLWHYPVFRALQDHGLGRLQILLVGSAITYFFAFLSYCLIEHPLLRYRRSHALRQVQTQ